MKTKCYSVRLAALTRISEKCYIATSFDGREAFIPAKFVLGIDSDVAKSDAWWIAAWILEKVNIQYSAKKSAWFEDGKRLPSFSIEKHQPERHQPVDNVVTSLLK